MRCPVCRADNDQGPQCRRCRADLASLFALEDQRRRVIRGAFRRLAAGELRRARMLTEGARALRDDEGDILAFLPGIAEIRRTMQALEEEAVAAQVLPLYGELTFKQQQEAIRQQKCSGRSGCQRSTNCKHKAQ